MAKRKYKAKKMQPAVTRLWFHINSRNTSNYIDLSLAASAANRRFYRQGLSWAVAGMTLHTAPDSETTTVTGNFDVSKIPETWMAANAHTMVKNIWMKSQDQVLDDQPSIAAKYRDFKIYMDDDMVGAIRQGVGSNPANDGEILMPIDRRNLTALPGEWVYSTIQLPNAGGSGAPTEVNLHMVGANVTTGTQSRGLITGYGLARSRPQLVDPNVPSDVGWITDVFDVADNLDEIRLDVADNNDLPPYRVGDTQTGTTDEYYPGGENNQPNTQLHTVEFISGTTVGGKTHVNGGIFPCGLIRFDWAITQAETSMFLAVDLVPGTHKGYLAEAY
jgi:hypothetical protein